MQKLLSRQKGKTMGRLIDADALKAKKTYSHERHEYIVPVAEIDWMPTIDAVPVVRCKECKYFIRINEEGGECDLYHQSHWIKFYCADGEREDADRNNSEIPNS